MEVPDEPIQAKGFATRERILARALELASQLGLEGLTIGELAANLGMSKSGLFAHFKSKERLQLAVLEHAAGDFAAKVFVPALSLPRGEARLRGIFENWLDWVGSRSRGGCVFLAGAIEYDDRSGAVRQAIVGWFEELYAGIRKAASLAITAGEFRKDLDLEQLASELHGIVLKFHVDSRLLESPEGRKRSRVAFERLMQWART